MQTNEPQWKVLLCMVIKTIIWPLANAANIKHEWQKKIREKQIQKGTKIAKERA